MYSYQYAYAEATYYFTTGLVPRLKLKRGGERVSLGTRLLRQPPYTIYSPVIFIYFRILRAPRRKVQLGNWKVENGMFDMKLSSTLHFPDSRSFA